MNAIPAAFRFVINAVWGSDTTEVCEVLLQKVTTSEKNKAPVGNVKPENCIRGHGVVAQAGVNGGFIGKHYYNNNIEKPLNLKKDDVVEYLYNHDENGCINITKIVEIVNDLNSARLEGRFQSQKQVVVTKVKSREGRDVFGSDPGVMFNLDKVKIDFVPVVGDWLELYTVVQSLYGEEDKNPGDKLKSKVTEVRALRSLEVKISTITHWDESAGIGTIGDMIFFRVDACSSFTPSMGDKVVFDAIESDQGNLTWRAVSVVFASKNAQLKRNTRAIGDNKEYTIKDITIDGDFNFGKMKIGETKTISVKIINSSNYTHKCCRAVFCSELKHSQIKMTTGPTSPFDIPPKDTIHFSFECKPFFMGYTEEVMKFHINKMFLKKIFKVYVQNEFCGDIDNKKNSIPKRDVVQTNFKKLRETYDRNIIKGEKISRAPAFIKVRMPPFIIPAPLWSILFKYYESKLTHSSLVEDSLPILTDELNMSTYREKFHTLLYLEEIAHIVALRSFDMEQAFLIPEGEYLTLEVKGLAEGRPSLVMGDCIKVRDPYDTEAPVYEGYIHETASDKIYAKFSPTFHNKYKGEDVSVFFTTSRTNMVLFHYAIDLAIKNLGKEIVFPEKIFTKEAILEITDSTEDKFTNKKRRVEWFNDKLNEVQRAGIINCIKNVARPLPYVIFGPPGTGKTITLVEVVLQIWKLLPESRLLIVTPSNSSADLFVERLIDSANLTPGTLVRIVAFHLMKSNYMTEKLKPFCAAIDISEQNTSHQIQMNDSDKKMFLKPNIGRHRITVTTCVAAGKMIHLGFPKGHFTHVIMDEAGQASEPECMIPLSFMDRRNGQIILAGDPQQLGPVIISNHSIQYGLEESYLGRLIKTLPYKRDVDSFKGKFDGYNPKLITKLLYNYRAIPRLLTLPSELYYNGSLVSKVPVDKHWVADIIQKVSSEVKLSDDGQHPGIVFYGIRGINMKEEESPSWYNPHEASMLALFISKLYQNGITVDDVGVISPYIQQNKFIRTILSDLELDIPKVGTVEEFQGQEKKIIIASTVRSLESNLYSKFNNLSERQIMGFLRNPKRLNVLLTRAQVLLVIFGNPHTLAMHEDWKHVIEYSIQFGSYVGCDVPRNVYCKKDTNK